MLAGSADEMSKDREPKTPGAKEQEASRLAVMSPESNGMFGGQGDPCLHVRDASIDEGRAMCRVGACADGTC